MAMRQPPQERTGEHIAGPDRVDGLHRRWDLRGDRQPVAQQRGAGGAVTATLTADADGFNVALKGQFREGQDIESGVQAVAALSGVDSVDATGVWEIEAPEAAASVVIGSPVVFAWSGDTVTVSGTISTEEQQDFVVTSLGTLTVGDGTVLRFSSVDVANVEILEGLEPEDDWIGTIIAFVGTLAAGLDEGSITVNPAGEVVTTAGEAETRQLKRDLTDASEDLVVALGDDVDRRRVRWEAVPLRGP